MPLLKVGFNGSPVSATDNPTNSYVADNVSDNDMAAIRWRQDMIIVSWGPGFCFSAKAL
jgi:hypothetical protein